MERAKQKNTHRENSPHIKRRREILPVRVLRRLIIPIGAMVFTILIGANITMSMQYRDNTNKRAQKTVGSVSTEFDLALEYQAQGLASTIQVILTDPELPNALKAKDKDLLSEKWLPIFEKLREEHNITHFYFFDSNRVCFLRVHKPDKSGDVIDRFTAKEAERTGQLAKGLELGLMGTFTLRVVQPVFHDGQLLGFVELGKEIEDVLGGLGNSVVVTIHKEFLDRKQWEEGMRLLDRDADWDQFANNVVIYPNKSELPIPQNYYQNIDIKSNDSRINSANDYNIDGQSWEVLAKPISDVSGQEVGSLLITNDITSEKAAYYRMMIFGGGITSVLLILLLGLLFILLRKTDNAIQKQQIALRESEAFQTATLRSIGDGVIVTDCSGCIIKLNKVAERLTGWSTNEAYGKPITEVFNIINAQTRAVAVNPVKEVLQKGIILGLSNHTALIARHGIEYQIADSCSPIRGIDNQIAGAVLVFRDVTVEYKQRELLQKSEEKYRLLFEYAVSAIGMYEIVFDDNGIPIDYIYKSVNPAFESHTGLKIDQAIGRRATEVIPGIEKSTLIDTYGNVVVSGEPVSFEQYCEPLKRHFFINAYRLDENQFATVFTNITERVHTESALFEAERQYRILVENSYDIIYRLDNEGLITYLSPAVKVLLGYDAEQLIGKRFSEIIHPDDISACLDFLQRIRESGTREEGVEYRIKHFNGSWHWHISCATPLFFETGEVKGFVGNSRDVTQLKQTVIELVETTEKLERFFSVNLDLLCIVDLKGRFLRVNKAWEQTLGYKVEFLHMKSFLDFVHEEDISKTLEVMGSLEAKEQVLNFVNRYRTKTGSYRFIEWRSQPHGDLIYAAARDITDRIQIEHALRDQKEQFELAIKGSNDGIWDWNLRTNELYLSPRWKQQLGFKDEELSNEFISFESRIHPEDKDRIFRNVDRYLNGEVNVYDMEFRMLHKNGGYRWIWARGEALRESDGKAYRIAGSHTDITEQTEEKKKIEYSSFHDALTGFYNRAYLNNITIHSKTGIVYSFDIDKLKYVNDTFGHNEGDKLICTVAEIIKKCFRDTDTLVRMGGDEFIAIIPESDEHLAAARKVLLNRHIDEQNKKRELNYDISFSIGYAVYQVDGNTLEDLIKKADGRMYAEKKGKHRQIDR